MLESNDPGSTDGPVDLLEIGAGYFTNARVGQSNCGMGLEFSPRMSGEVQEFTLDRHGHYHFVECEGADGRRREIDVLSCAGAKGISSVTDLKKFLKIEVAD